MKVVLRERIGDEINERGNAEKKKLQDGVADEGSRYGWKQEKYCYLNNA